MILKNAGKLEIPKLKNLYEEAFPINERKPYSVLDKNMKNGTTDVLAIKDDDILGLVITVNYKDLVLIDYFAVDKAKRNSGIGGRALNLIREKYDDRRIFLEIETPSDSADNNAQRIKRKDFYLRNGLEAPGIYTNVYDTEMELLTFGKPVTFNEYTELYDHSMDEKWLEKFGRPTKLIL